MSGYTWADLKYQGGGRTNRTHVIRGEWQAHPQYIAFEKKAICGLSLSSVEAVEESFSHNLTEAGITELVRYEASKRMARENR